MGEVHAYRCHCNRRVPAGDRLGNGRAAQACSAHSTFLAPAPRVNGYHPRIDHRSAVNLAEARKPLTDPCDPRGYEVSMDYQQDRYANGAQIGTAVVSVRLPVAVGQCHSEDCELTGASQPEAGATRSGPS